MSTIKISLINNDQAICAKTDVDDTASHALSSFFEKIREELVTGNTALLEIEEPDKQSLRVEISQAV